MQVFAVSAPDDKPVQCKTEYGSVHIRTSTFTSFFKFPTDRKGGIRCLLTHISSQHCAILKNRKHYRRTSWRTWGCSGRKAVKLFPPKRFCDSRMVMSCAAYPSSFSRFAKWMPAGPACHPSVLKDISYLEGGGRSRLIGLMVQEIGKTAGVLCVFPRWCCVGCAGRNVLQVWPLSGD